MITAALMLAAANCAILPPDDRAYCQAIESGQPHYCAQIADYGRRQQCRAELGGGSAECNMITDATARELCRSRAR